MNEEVLMARYVRGSMSVVIGLVLSTVGLAAGNVDGTSELSVKARAYTVSCAYYSNITSDLAITYHNELLPWGSHVFFQVGWGGKRWVNSPSLHETSFTWEEISSLEMKAIAPNTWSVQLTKGLHDRTEGAIRTEMDFVVRVQLPSGQAYWDKPGRGNTSYYVVALPAGQKCVGDDADLPPMQDMVIRNVQ